MRRYIKFKLLGLTLLLVAFAACTAEQEVEPVVSPEGYPVAAFTNVTGLTVAEGDTIVYNISIDKTIDRALTFSFVQTGGTADEDDYYTASAVIQPYTKSTQLMIITFVDFDFSPSETLTGEIGVFGIADRYLLDPGNVNPTPTFTINNVVSPNLEMAFYWDGEVLIDGDPYDASDYVDFDFYIADATDFDISNPWPNDLGIYDAATGAHPEELVLEDMDDGEYIIFVDMYSNGFAGESNDSTTIGIRTYFTRQGTSLIDHEVAQDEADMLVAHQGVYGAVIAKIVKAADKYTIYDGQNTSVGTFKSVTVKTSRPATIPKMK